MPEVIAAASAAAASLNVEAGLVLRLLELLSADVTRLVVRASYLEQVISHHYSFIFWGLYTDKNENKIFLINKEIQMGSGAKSYRRKGFLIYEEMRKWMSRPLVIYDFAPRGGNTTLLPALATGAR